MKYIKTMAYYEDSAHKPVMEMISIYLHRVLVSDNLQPISNYSLACLHIIHTLVFELPAEPSYNILNTSNNVVEELKSATTRDVVSRVFDQTAWDAAL